MKRLIEARIGATLEPGGDVRLLTRDEWRARVSESQAAIKNGNLEFEEKGQRLFELGDLAEGIAQWTKALAHQPDSPAILRNRGQLYVRLGKWKEAADDFVAVVRTEPSDVGDWLRAAPLLVLAGDEEAFRRHCLNMLDQFRGDPELRAQSITAKVCLLTPDIVPLANIPLEALEAALDAGSAPDRQSWDWAVRALAAYRSGDASKALDYIAEAAKTPAYEQNSRLRALALSVKALAQAASGQADPAKQTLAQTNEIVEEGLSRIREGAEDAWHDVLIAHILCQEAAKRIQDAKED